MSAKYVREREKMQDKTENSSRNDILEGFKNSGSSSEGTADSRQEALDKVNEMFAAARAAGKQPKKKKTVSAPEPVVQEKAESVFEKPQKNESYQEAVDKVTEMLSAPKNDNSKTEDGEQADSRQEAVDRVAEMFDKAIAANGKRKKSGSDMSSASMEIIVLEVISILFFIFSINSSLPEVVSLIAVFMPAIVGIISRMLLQQLTLKDAVSKCKLHIAVTFLFLMIAVMSLA
ncbi:MAG: hypothetical protein K6G33_12585 [Ruminococcus sp.]|uniref:hypothetical protein n=1 Tax=Ruminococcus sp. TaxID=41978 RepID=UPI0025CCAEF2|nr:hypothetical protein [Ruminococcus sp.]MCR5601566.1 hypothetical protein [Ruminococcus sp.]